MIIASDQPTVRTCKNNLRIFWRRGNPARLAAAHVVPVPFPYAKVRCTTGYAHSRIVLLGTVDVVGEIVVERNPIKLCRGLILFGPTFPAIERNVCATVIAIDHSIRIAPDDPNRMINSNDGGANVS